MRTSIRSRISVVAIAAIGATLLVPTLMARGVSPTYFPPNFSENATAFSLRFAGNDRFLTAGTGALVAATNHNTKTGWPFNTATGSDPANAYGANACPKTVFIVASDGLPDALASASLRDIATLTPSGSSHTFDTTDALLLLTATARPPDNATGLTDSTKTALTQIKNACSGGFDAIILGGTAAVPQGAEADLGAYANNVGRIAGVDRYDTAGQIASAVSSRVGLGKPTYFSSSSDKGTVESGTVFLADAITGADALSVSPVSADTHTPILLANSSELPAATSDALTTLKPTNIIVLGGTAVLPDAIVTQAKQAAGSSNAPIRIAGANRYATSVDVANKLDDIWSEATDNENTDIGKWNDQQFGFARSEGTGDNHVGWPDALSSALVLESMNKLATAPTRITAPVESNLTDAGSGKTGINFVGGKSSPGRVPLLLVTQAAEPPEVHSFLTGLYKDKAGTTSSPDLENQNGYRYEGGFGFVFGGFAAVSSATELSVGKDLSGGLYTAAAQSDLLPKFDSSLVFYTAESFLQSVTPGQAYLESGAGTGGVAPQSSWVDAGDKVCTMRGADTGVSFMELVDSNNALLNNTKPGSAIYEPSGSSFPAGKSEIVCMDARGLTSANLLGVSLSGGLSNAVPLDWSSAANTLRTQDSTGTPSRGSAAEPDAQGGYEGSAPGQSIDQPAGMSPTILDLSYSGKIAATTSNTGSVLTLPLDYKGTNYTHATMTVKLTRASSGSPNTPDPITCTGTVTGQTDSGSTVFSATFAGESSTAPSGQPGGSNVIACVGEYSIGTIHGGIHFLITGDNNTSGVPPAYTPAALSDLVLDGLA